MCEYFYVSTVMSNYKAVQGKHFNRTISSKMKYTEKAPNWCQFDHVFNFLQVTKEDNFKNCSVTELFLSKGCSSLTEGVLGIIYCIFI